MYGHTHQFTGGDTPPCVMSTQFQRTEPAHDIQHSHRGPDHLPPNILNIRIGFHCFHDCLVFLLCGVIFVDGQGALVEPGYAYRIKDEECLGLGGNTTVLIMEEGDAKGLCVKQTKEWQEKYNAETEAAARRAARPWNRVFSKFHQK